MKFDIQESAMPVPNSKSVPLPAAITSPLNETPITKVEVTEMLMTSASPPDAESTHPSCVNWNPPMSAVEEYARSMPSRAKHISAL